MKKIAIYITALLLLILGINFYNSRIDNIEFDTEEYDTEENDTTSKMNINDYDIALKNIEGDSVDLSDYKGKIIILNFWATWCGPCIYELPEFDEFSKEIDKEEVALFMINLTDGVREKQENVIKYIQNEEFSFNVLFDEKTKIADQFNVTYIPSTFIFDKEGNLITNKVGATTKKELNKFLEGARK